MLPNILAVNSQISSLFENLKTTEGKKTLHFFDKDKKFILERIVDRVRNILSTVEQNPNPLIHVEQFQSLKAKIEKFALEIMNANEEDVITESKIHKFRDIKTLITDIYKIAITPSENSETSSKESEENLFLHRDSDNYQVRAAQTCMRDYEKTIFALSDLIDHIMINEYGIELKEKLVNLSPEIQGPTVLLRMILIDVCRFNKKFTDIDFLSDVLLNAEKRVLDDFLRTVKAMPSHKEAIECLWKKELNPEQANLLITLNRLPTLFKMPGQAIYGLGLFIQFKMNPDAMLKRFSPQECIVGFSRVGHFEKALEIFNYVPDSGEKDEASNFCKIGVKSFPT